MKIPWDGYSTSSTGPDAQKMRDLDETRRLLYVALFTRQAIDRGSEPVGLSKHAELAGTITNALAHHSAKIEPAISGPHIGALLTSPDGPQPEAVAWAEAQIAKITELLGDG